ncbi:MAG: alpha/beta hydrolase family protein [Phycisphaerales bacterium]
MNADAPSPITLPSALARQTRFVRLAADATGRPGIPALLAHPDWSTPCPTVIWLHGRTVSKELDNGRYLRFLRAGIATCAIDLPGHGERFDPAFHTRAATLDLVALGVAEIDRIVAALAERAFAGVFDASRLALGGMSAGGMITLRRLCDPHPFRCACIEGAAGNLEMLFSGSALPPHARPERIHTPERVAPLDPIRHLATWRPIPLLALHSEADEIVPLACITTFADALRAHYAALGLGDSPGSGEGVDGGSVPSSAAAPPVVLHTWPTTGAPREHNGFGRVAAEAKTIQLAFLQQHL